MDSRIRVIAMCAALAGCVEAFDVPLRDPVPGTFVTVAPMLAGREGPLAALLEDGTVLVTGGLEGGTALASAEVFSLGPTGESTWGSTADMTYPRYGHTSTRLLDGRVLVAGGNFGTNYFDHAEVYDPLSGWSSFGPMAHARSGHSANLLSTGEIVISGGYDGQQTLAIGEGYYPGNGYFSGGQVMVSPRSAHGSAVLPGNRVLVIGGVAPGGVVIAECEMLDYQALWRSVAPMHEARFYPGVVTLPGGNVLVFGGERLDQTCLSSVELYDAGSDSWTLLTEMPQDRCRFSATLLPSGAILIAGGFGSGTAPRDETWLFDPNSGVWVGGPDLGGPRSAHVAVPLPSGQVLFAGGWSGFAAISSARLYTEPTTGPGGGQGGGTDSSPTP